MIRKPSFIFLAICMLVALLTVLYAGDRKQDTLKADNEKSLATHALEITQTDIAAQLNSTKLTAADKVKALTRHFRASKQADQPVDVADLKQQARQAKVKDVRVSKEAHR